ncbi:uncharacterized protein STEHIDRAFT_111710 [Stereum hirsutum FP-91666 SS1]|uniref:uncharacterized protein n=1 Tax=Stereum hirsutum (strain FP-91666) TaxID=721885 RepID=UPI000444A28C|nr:uncharacterized protein STEHIDRAFT_111710 [Stereum hirsutum FP-91666 SS1]EIM86194.1 hypothetical protein STEHIDRAFT_111710 [Stereum hirsutum FP-91666 SS1]
MTLVTLVFLLLASQLLHLMVLASPTQPTPPLPLASQEDPLSPIPSSYSMSSDSHAPRSTPAGLPPPSDFHASFTPARPSSLSSSIMDTASPPTLLASPATFSATLTASSVIVPAFHPTVTASSVSLASPEQSLPDGEESQNLSPVTGVAIGIAVAYSLWTRDLRATAADTANLVINILRILPDARAELHQNFMQCFGSFTPTSSFSHNASVPQSPPLDTLLATTSLPAPYPQREMTLNVVNGQSRSVGDGERGSIQNGHVVGGPSD